MFAQTLTLQVRKVMENAQVILAQKPKLKCISIQNSCMYDV